jgi:hypothetical protein
MRVRVFFTLTRRPENLLFVSVRFFPRTMGTDGYYIFLSFFLFFFFFFFFLFPRTQRVVYFLFYVTAHFFFLRMRGTVTWYL